jgi:hypothetical protein
MVMERNNGHKHAIWSSQEDYSLLECILMLWKNLLPPLSGQIYSANSAPCTGLSAAFQSTKKLFLSKLL